MSVLIRLGNMAYRTRLTLAIQVVVFLFSSFGGFLGDIAPPEETGVRYVVGILSFLTLLALLTISAIARLSPGPRFRKRWIIAGVASTMLAIPAAVRYAEAIRTYTWAYPSGGSVRRVRGDDYSDLVKAYLQENEGQSSDPKLLASKFELSDLWTAESISRASTRLLVLYGWLVLSLATAVFCLLEANSVARVRRKVGDKESGLTGTADCSRSASDRSAPDP